MGGVVGALRVLVVIAVFCSLRMAKADKNEVWKSLLLNVFLKLDGAVVLPARCSFLYS